MQVALLLMVSQFFFTAFPTDWQMDQQNVAVRGTVVDEQGRAVPGAAVYATSGAIDARTVSDSKGEFIFLTLLPGSYCLGASVSHDDISSPNVCAPPELFAGFEYDATIVLSR